MFGLYRLAKSAYGAAQYIAGYGQGQSNENSSVADSDRPIVIASEDAECDGRSDNVSIDVIGQRIRELNRADVDKEEEERIIGDLIQAKACEGNLLDGVDSKGHSLVQHAAYVGSVPLTKLLLSLGLAVEGPVPGCSPPLHLACMAGNAELCRILLHAGARSDLRAALCYPDTHPEPSRCSRFGLPLTAVMMGLSGANQRMPCPGEAQLPVQTLLPIDADHVLDVFLQAQYQSWVGQLSVQQLFCEACRLGSERCVHLFLNRFPIQKKTDAGPVPPGASRFSSFVTKTLSLDQLDDTGYSPFLYAVASCSLDTLNWLITLGANPLQESASGETALHVVFRYLSCLDQLAGRINLLLGNGLESAVGHRDSYGCTALHSLAGHVNTNYRYLGALVPWSPTHGGVFLCADPVEQACYQRQILSCLELLLRHNCPPRLPNSEGRTPLDLVYEAFSSFLSHDVDPNFAAPLTYLYIFDMDVLAETLDLFYSNGCSPNDRGPKDSCFQPPLKRLLHGILNISPVQYHTFRGGYLRCLEVLCKHGAEINFRLANDQGGCSTLVAALAESIVNTVGVGSFRYDRRAKEANAAFIDDILRCLLKGGLDPNWCGKRRRPFMQGGRGNALCDFVHLSRVMSDLSDLRFLGDWLRTLLQGGADPNLEPYPAEPSILHSQSSIFLRHQTTIPLHLLLHHLREAGGRATSSPYTRRLVLLLHATTRAALLHTTLREFTAKLEREDRRSPVLQLIADLVNTPRSLKQESRLAVVQSLRGRLRWDVVKQLDLPAELDRYLLDIEP